jgi:hypothetical protein
VQQKGPKDELQAGARADGVDRPEGIAGESSGTEASRTRARRCGTDLVAEQIEQEAEAQILDGVIELNGQATGWSRRWRGQKTIGVDRRKEHTI